MLSSGAEIKQRIPIFFKIGLAFLYILGIIVFVMTFRDSSMVEHSAVNR